MFKVYTLEESKEWEKIVRSFSNFDVYYLPEYAKAFEIHNDGQPLLIYFNKNDKRAINVVMKRDIANADYFSEILEPNMYFDLATPYGYGGFLYEGDFTPEDIQELNSKYTEYCNEMNIISEFVRIHPLNNSELVSNQFYQVEKLGSTVTMDLSSVEIIWDNFNSKNRNSVRKATKSGVEVYWGRDPYLFEKFKEIYEGTMDKDNADTYYYFEKDFYNSILYDLKNESLIFYATKDEEIISMAIIMFTNKNMHYHLSGSKREYNKFNPSNLLLTEVANWGAKHDYEVFHLGGGLGASHDDLYKFKKKFNKKEDLDYFIAKKIFNEDMYNELISLRGKIENENFFPKYRG